MSFLIVIPTTLESRVLAECVQEIDKQASASDQNQILVVINRAEVDLDEAKGELLNMLRSWIAKKGIVIFEPRRGVPFVRNAAMRYFLQESCHEFLLFFDDDQVPLEGWLEAFEQSRKKYRTSILSGPVKPLEYEGAPEWRKKLVTERPWRDREDGAVMKMAYTGNTAIPRSLLLNNDLWFDERFGTSGGSDAEFFLRVRNLNLANHDFRYVAGGMAIEHYGPWKTSLRGIFLRRVGRRSTAARLAIDSGTMKRSLVLGKAVKSSFRVIRSASLALLKFELAGRHGIETVERLADVVGYLMGAIRKNYKEYAENSSRK